MMKWNDKDYAQAINENKYRKLVVFQDLIWLLRDGVEGFSSR